MESLNVVRIAAHRQDNRLLTPQEMLAVALDEHKAMTEDEQYNKAMLLTLRADGEEYEAGYYACNMRRSEMAALLSTVLHRLTASLSGADEE